MKYVLIALAILAAAAAAVAVIYLLHRRKNDSADLLTAVVGATVTVTEEITPGACNNGAAAFKGTEWAARGVAPETAIAKGEKATVVAVEGVKLILKP